MKRLIFILTILFAVITSYAQQPINVTLNDGRLIVGKLIDGNDTIITVKCTNASNIKQMGEVVTVNICDTREIKLFDPNSGKMLARYTPDKWTMPEIIFDVKHSEFSLPSDPNVVIGKAFKTAGGVSIGIGVPCMIAGTALIIAGKQKQKQSAEIFASNKNISSSDILNYSKQSIKASGMYTAGCALLPVGAGFTIVGIPLFVNGKRIMNMNFNLTGNGAGVALQF